MELKAYVKDMSSCVKKTPIKSYVIMLFAQNKIEIVREPIKKYMYVEIVKKQNWTSTRGGGTWQQKNISINQPSSDMLWGDGSIFRIGEQITTVNSRLCH